MTANPVVDLCRAWIAWDERPSDRERVMALLEATHVVAGRLGVDSVEFTRLVNAARRGGRLDTVSAISAVVRRLKAEREAASDVQRVGHMVPTRSDGETVTVRSDLL